MIGDIFEKFHIGAYCLGKNARDENHVKELADCGIDILFGVDYDKPLLDLLDKYGVSAVVNGVVPGWFGSDGKNAGKLEKTNSIDSYIQGAQRFLDHPAIIGIDIGDEPSSLDFPYYGKVVAELSKHFKEKLLYLNIYPSYGMLAGAGDEQAKRELGTDTYLDYLTAYCENVPLPYLSIDHYPHSSDLECFLSDLADASGICRAYSKPLMTVLQANSNDEKIFLSADELRLEAYSALAYGARTISWACYSPGWWHNNVLDRDGNKTEQYEKLKAVNAELRRFTREYEKYTHIATRHLDSGESASFPSFKNIRATAPVIIGSFEDADGSPAILISPLCYEELTEVSFETSSQDRLYCRDRDGKKELLGTKNTRHTVTAPAFVFYE